jgi:alpha-2-macroglobulin-like protein
MKRSPLMRSLCLAMPVMMLATPFAQTIHAAPRRAKQAPAASKSELSPLETQVMGQSRWLKNGPASLRVIVTDHLTGKPQRGTVRIAAHPIVDGKPTQLPIELYRGTTNAQGTLNASFKAAGLPPGTSELRVVVDTPLGKDEIKQNIEIAESNQILLTADKPLYQPGQTIHLRALALDMATRTPLGNKPITFEVEDARGNKVFKKKGTLSKFGVASSEFVLAHEVNMGTFTLRAVLPDSQIEKKVRVERYVLPKFKAEVKTDKSYYLPGETVKGTLSAKYFFGKPVANSEVTVIVNTVDIGVTKLTELKGKTDPIGGYTFRYTLPKSFVGQPFEQGKAVVEFDATVKDTAEHKQQTVARVPVVKDPLQIVVVPENRALVPGIQNRFYAAVATPDGAPIKNTPITVALEKGWENANTPPLNATTDELGIAEFAVTPLKGNEPIQLGVTVNLPDGRRADVHPQFNRNGSDMGVILRVDKPMAKVGDKIGLTALSTIKTGTLYLDVIKNRQTILTHAIPMKDGKASYSLPVTNDMAGTLELHAYKILPDENIIRDTRTVVASPASDLAITVAADKDTYRPGTDAKLTFTVRDSQKRPLQAALGLAMVDESVFALSELQPGLEKIYFTLEKELMEPKYEIHGLRPTGLIDPIPVVRDLAKRDGARQRAAGMILAAVEPQTNFDFRHNTFAVRYQKLLDELIQEQQKAHAKIADAVRRYAQDTKTTLKTGEGLMLLVEKGYLRKSDLLDRWGRQYRANTYNQPNYGYFTLIGAGPDGKFETNDDVQEELVYRRRFAGRPMGGIGGGGGRGGGVAEERMELFALADAAAPAMMAQNGAAPLKRMAAMDDRAKGVKFKEEKQDGGGGGDAPRIREYFPETLLWNPQLITDERGEARLTVPMADSITSWRMSVMGSSLSGIMGSTTSAVRVFQDFFADIDLPVSLTQNDRVEIPVAVYNYLPQAQDVTLTLKTEPWFTLSGSATQTVKMEAGAVKMLAFPITVKAIGNHALTVTAKGTKLSDAIRRTIEVLPDGKEFRPTINDRLEGKVEKTVTLPAAAIAEANNVWVKLYPGTFSQVVEGMDGILQMPNGCFEQTSSTTYPNILVLDYLKATKRINPEIQLKAEQYINVGYQRLVTFEVKTGGFSWFGEAPAHQILTAYGLLEFADMSKVHEVDPALISRTQAWLASQQKPDGTWEEKNQGIAEGIINRQTGALRSTAYVAWALAETGYKGPELAKGVSWVKEHRADAKDAYTLAVILNLLTVVERDSETTADAANKLIALAKTSDKAAWWETDTQTFTGAVKEGADLETTGLAAFGLVKWGRNAGLVNKVLTYLVQNKNSFGTWSSTQGTVWSMKSLLHASRNAVGGGKGKVVVMANGQKAAQFDITPEDSDVMRQVSLAEWVKPGQNAISLEYQGEGAPLYQIVTRYYLPWDKIDQPAPEFQPLSLDVKYDKTTLAQDDTATVTVTIKNVTTKIAEMPLIDVGVPPGFQVVPDDLEKAVESKSISKYTVAARQVIIYMEKLDPGQELKLTYQVRAKFPIKARTPLSKAYPYYNPARVATVAPTDLVVNK